MGCHPGATQLGVSVSRGMQLVLSTRIRKKLDGHSIEEIRNRYQEARCEWWPMTYTQEPEWSNSSHDLQRQRTLMCATLMYRAYRTVAPAMPHGPATQEAYRSWDLSSVGRRGTPLEECPKVADHSGQVT
jgi:hypothetical protein